MASQVVVTLWWLGFWTAVGVCLGSFLNVVIYRLPRRRSLRTPLWSACPYCSHRIRWYDNLPIVSFILLRGRCRDCRAPIPTRYLVIEATTALIVLILLDAFMISGLRDGLCTSRFGLTEKLAYDWPIVVAHVVLFACLISMSAIDLEHYWVDIRFTNLATFAGFVLHALWTPKHSMDWPRPGDPTAVASLMALAGLGVVWLVFVCRPHMDPEDFGEAEDRTAETSEQEGPPADPLPPIEPPSRLLAWAAGLLLVAVFVWLFVAALSDDAPPPGARILVPLMFVFLLIVREGTVHRSSDHAIIEAIEEERHSARRMVLTELAILLPAVLLAAVAIWLMAGEGDFPQRLSGVLHAKIRLWSLPSMRNWLPLLGLATAAAGYVVAGAVGWIVRIVFTLAFGREAFGAGDIHLMAAAGCVAGWPVVVLGFLLTCILAIAGWLLCLPFKRTRAIPLGPWLALAFLIVVIYYDQIIEWRIIAHAVHTVHLLFY